MHLKAPTFPSTAQTTKAVKKRQEAKAFIFFLSVGAFIQTLCNSKLLIDEDNKHCVAKRTHTRS